MLILATGAMGDAPILMRSRTDLPSLSDQVGKHLGSNGDHVAAIEFDPAKVRERARPARLRQFYKGKPITTMTYDFWVGRRGHRFDGTRFTLQEIFLSSLTNFLYDDGRDPAGDPSWWGLQKKQAIANWANRIELLAMVEDTNDGAFCAVAAGRRRDRVPTPGRSRSGRSTTRCPSSRSACARRPTRAMRAIAERRGLGAVHEADRDPGRLRLAPARRLPDGGRRPTSASSTPTARCSATRACTASARRSSRRRWASTRR